MQIQKFISLFFLFIILAASCVPNYEKTHTFKSPYGLVPYGLDSLCISHLHMRKPTQLGYLLEGWLNKEVNNNLKLIRLD